MDERTLNDLLECSVCLERLDTTSKVLPCQHTFCRKCLEVIVSSHTELRCPECRVLVDIKIDDLPPNVLLMRILEGMKNASSHNHHYHHQIINNSVDSDSTSILLPLNGILQPEIAHPQQQQQQQQHQLQPQSQAQSFNQTVHSSKSLSNFHITNRTNDESNIMRQIQQQQPNSCNKQLVPNTGGVTSLSPSSPHAKALYDFASKEAGDLSFKKGDNIYLRRRIDLNWFVGECNGREGVFPINHVQIITPMPLPQCKALYDFRMGPNEEEGCLTFKKGAIINVFRRVDQNWAEGRIGECIGIFPIAFVEMNALAKQLMDVTTKYIHYTLSPRSVPPTPTEPQNTSTSSDSSSTITTSPNSSATSNTSSNSSTAPSSPVSGALLQQATPTVLAQQQQQQQQVVAASIAAQKQNVMPQTATATAAVSQKREKRYSLNSAVASNATNLTGNSCIKNSNRHSTEILLPSSEKSKEKTQRYSSKVSNAHDLHETPDNKSTGSKSNPSHRQRHHSPSTSRAGTAAQNTFVALYPYKPQKADELELKKGSIYYVKERCQDGWYKGTNRAQKSGVFPGNYVAPLRQNSHGDTPHQCPGSSGASAHHKRSTSHHTANVVCSNNSSSAAQKIGNFDTVPELPPRSGGSSIPPISSSVWSKPLGQHVEALFGRKSSGNASQQSNNKSETNKDDIQSNNSSGKKEQNLSSALTSSATVSLIKRFANIKRSKSPVNSSVPSYSMDNPVFEDNIGATANGAPATQSANKRNAIHLSHPVHVRSGSCPSQLLQSLPIEINLASAQNGAALKADNKTSNDVASTNTSYLFGSQRIKGHKERPTLQGMRQSLETNRLRTTAEATTAQPQHMVHHMHNKSSSHHPFLSNPSTSVSSSSSSYHRKSQSLDAATIAAQIGNNNPSAVAANVGNGLPNKTKTYAHNEKFKCIVSYPPNSEFELELLVGDIVFVHKKRDNGWYKGTHGRTGKVGLFPSSFVEPDI